MELQVRLQFDDLSSINCNLKLSIQKGNVFFEYVDERNHSIIRESITQFRIIQLSEEDPTRVSIQGPIVDRILHFENPKDSNAFFGYILNQGILLVSENDARTFHINIKDDSKKKTPFHHLIQSLYQSASKVPQVVQRPVDAFVSKRIFSYLPTDKLMTLTPDMIDSLQLPLLPLYSYHIPRTTYPHLIKQFVNPADITEEYQKLKEQWQSTSQNQWKHFLQLREFVHSIELYIEHSNLPTENHKRLFFNVSVSLFTRYFSHLSFGPSLMFIVDILIFCFLSSQIEGDKFITTLGEKLDLNSAELFIFSYLADIWESMRKTSLTIDKESDKIRKELSSISPSTLAMLDDRKLVYLDFAVQDADVFFSKAKNQEDALLLFTAALQTGDISVFRRNIICIALVLLQEKLQLIPFDQPNQFVDTYRYNSILINARLLVLNNTKLISQQIEQQ